MRKNGEVSSEAKLMVKTRLGCGGPIYTGENGRFGHSSMGYWNFWTFLGDEWL